MSRGFGVTEVLADAPTVVVVLFAVVTQLGDFWFVGSATVLAYLLAEDLPVLGRGLTRERAAMVLALLVTAAALTVSLKALFALPRPAGAGTAATITVLPDALQGIYASMATGTGFGFPSGHAITTTLVWGGFAWALRVGTPRQRYAVAGVAVLLVSLSRLVLGVHFLVDVVAGVLVAGLVLVVSLRVLGRPAAVIGVAVVLAVLGVALDGFHRETAAILGMAVGATAGWLVVDGALETTREGTVTAAAVGVGLFGVGGAVYALFDPGPVVVSVLAAAATGAVVALPLAGDRLAKKV